MPGFDDVRRLALELPETHETTAWGNVAYKVRKAMFVWERPLNKADRERWTDDPPPEGPIVGLRVVDLDAKDQLLVEEPASCFTIQHLRGFAAVLCLIERIELDRLQELIIEAWLARAPKTLAKDYLARS